MTGARPQQLVLTATLPTKDIGPLTVGLRRQPDGRYRAEDVLLPNPGRWMFTAVVRRQSSTLSPRPCPIQVD